MIDANWLFENHQYLVEMEKKLPIHIQHICYPDRQNNAEDILSQVLSLPMLGMPPQKSHSGSSTERIALLLQGVQSEHTEETLTDLLESLSVCKVLVNLYKAIVLSLTPGETWLIHAIYDQKLTSTALRNSPDCPYGLCDRSTIYRNRKRIIEKANNILQYNIPKEVSECRLEKFVKELKRFQNRNITN